MQEREIEGSGLLSYCCASGHNYALAGKESSKNGDLVQIVYCTKCADRKEIVLKEH